VSRSAVVELARTPGVLLTEPDLATITNANHTGPPLVENTARPASRRLATWTDGVPCQCSTRSLTARTLRPEGPTAESPFLKIETSRARDGRWGYDKWPHCGRSTPPVTVDQLDLFPNPYRDFTVESDSGQSTISNGGGQGRGKSNIRFTFARSTYPVPTLRPSADRKALPDRGPVSGDGAVAPSR
jgi:hypothetical protein